MNDDYKIWFPHEVFYIESLLSITRTVMCEKNVTIIFLEEIENKNFKNQKLLIDSVQNIINQSALISRFFWPVSKESVHKKRGQKLRQVYGITESNLLKNRDVRNFIEHFDEKLDLYLNQFITGLIIPSYVGPRISLEAKHLFRAYFIDEAIFKILDLEYAIIPIVDEIERIHFLLENDMKTGRFSSNRNGN